MGAWEVGAWVRRMVGDFLIFLGVMTSCTGRGRAAGSSCPVVVVIGGVAAASPSCPEMSFVSSSLMEITGLCDLPSVSSMLVNGAVSALEM